MIHLDLASFAPLGFALLVGVPVIVVIRRAGRAPTMREQVARDNARLLSDAGLIYSVPTVDGHSEKARAR